MASNYFYTCSVGQWVWFETMMKWPLENGANKNQVIESHQNCSHICLWYVVLTKAVDQILHTTL